MGLFVLALMASLTACGGGGSSGWSGAASGTSINTGKVAVTGVTLDKTSLSMLVGGTAQLTPTVAPANATSTSVTWASSNTSVATVSPTGTVTGLTAGTTTVTVTTVDGGFTATANIAVTPKPVPVTGVTLDKTSVAILVGSTAQLTPTVAPANATNTNVTWASSDTSVATVSPTGTVTALTKGTATVTVTTVDGNYTATATVTATPVQVAVTGITVDKTATVKVGSTAQLTATIAPANATNTNLTWSSSDPKIATVSSSGLVTGTAGGTVTITVTTADGNKTATCLVTVPWFGTTVLGVAAEQAGAISITTDSSGNVYMTGYTTGALYKDAKVGTWDGYLAKYDKYGNRTYVKQIGVAGVFTRGNAVRTDANGNVYVVGITRGGLDGNQLIGSMDTFVSKYDSQGNLKFTKQFGVAGQDTAATALAIDTNGNVFVAGQTQGGLPGNTLTGSSDLFVTKFDSQGNQLFTKQLGTALKDTCPYALAVDSAGNVFVTGFTTGTLDGNTLSGYQDLILVKFDNAGNKPFTKQMGGVADSIAAGTSVATDASGNVYVTGLTDTGLNGNAAIGGQDYFLIKFDSSGSQKFTKQIGVTNQTTNGLGITTDANGNVFVVGQTSGALVAGIKVPGLYNYFLTKFDSAGAVQYVRQGLPAGFGALAQSVATDADGNVFLAGFTLGDMKGDTTGRYAFVDKYTNAGEKQ